MEVVISKKNLDISHIIALAAGFKVCLKKAAAYSPEIKVDGRPSL